MTKPILNGFVQPAQSLSETSFFFIDSDVEDTGSETGDSFDDDGSPVDSSVESFSEQSQATTSPLDVVTPHSVAEDSSPNPIFRLKSVKGREEKDCHLFRATLASTQDLNWETYDPEIPGNDIPNVPAIPAQFKTDADELQGSTVGKDHPVESLGNDVRTWTTKDVAEWMYNSGFENFVISTFKTHDVDGCTLLDLAFEDLCELDISSFGKRRQIWNELIALRKEGLPCTHKMSTLKDDRGCNYLPGLNHAMDRTRRPGFDKTSSLTGYRRPMRSPSDHRTRKPPMTLEIPRPHRCSKGKRCPRWKQQQDILDEVDREHGPNTPPSGRFGLPSPRLPNILTPVTTTPSIPDPFGTSSSSDASTPTGPRDVDNSIPPVPPLPIHALSATPSVTAPAPPTIDTKHIVQQYQNNTPVSALTPETPQWDLFPNPGKSLPGHPPRQSSLASLPKLSIPLSPAHSPSSSDSTIRYGEVDPAVSPINPPSARVQGRTTSPELVPSPLSPSIFSRTRTPSPNLVAIAKQPSTDIKPSPVRQLRSPSSESNISVHVPPSLFKKDPRAIPTSGTPTRPHVLRSAISSDAIQRRRNVNPLPTLNEGSLTSNQTTESLSKPLPNIPPTLVPTSSRRPPASATNNAVRTPSPALQASPLTPSRSVSPIKPTNLAGSPRITTPLRSAVPPTPRSTSSPTPATPASIPSSMSSSTNPSPEPQSYGHEVVRVGWLRQRRARLLRHEWVPMHVRLTATHMTLHATARLEEKPIDTINMDEYEVQCTSSTGGNKITKTFRGFRSSSGSKGSNSSVGSIDESAFNFELVPTAKALEAYQINLKKEKEDATLKAAIEGKPVNISREDQVKLLKSFQFAVKTRDERIEWMRQLMMACAQGTRDSMRRAEKEGDVDATRPMTRSGSF